jgi:predicted NBD/HSP70 family sugar kinase
MIKNLEIYTTEVLHRWKEQRESDPREALRRLREVTPIGLRNIVSDALENHDMQLLQALDRLSKSDREAASLLRSLVDELTEAYSRLWQSLDPDLVYSLGKSVRELREIAPVLDVFTVALNKNARTLRNLEDY